MMKVKDIPLWQGKPFHLIGLNFVIGNSVLEKNHGKWHSEGIIALILYVLIYTVYTVSHLFLVSQLFEPRHYSYNTLNYYLSEFERFDLSLYWNFALINHM